MFQDNIAPLKEDKLLWEEYQREEQKFLKSNRNDDEGSSARNATPHKLKEKGIGLSPSGNKRNADQDNIMSSNNTLGTVGDSPFSANRE